MTSDQIYHQRGPHGLSQEVVGYWNNEMNEAHILLLYMSFLVVSEYISTGDEDPNIIYIIDLKQPNWMNSLVSLTTTEIKDDDNDDGAVK